MAREFLDNHLTYELDGKKWVLDPNPPDPLLDAPLDPENEHKIVGQITSRLVEERDSLEWRVPLSEAAQKRIRDYQTKIAREEFLAEANEDPHKFLLDRLPVYDFGEDRERQLKITSGGKVYLVRPNNDFTLCEARRERVRYHIDPEFERKRWMKGQRELEEITGIPGKNIDWDLDVPKANQMAVTAHKNEARIARNMASQTYELRLEWQRQQEDRTGVPGPFVDPDLAVNRSNQMMATKHERDAISEKVQNGPIKRRIAVAVDALVNKN